MVEALNNLGKMLFDELIGKANWTIIYITYEPKDNKVWFTETFYHKD